MNKEFLTVLAQLEREKGLEKTVLLDAVKHALAVAVKKIMKISSGASEDEETPEEEVKVDIDPDKGDIKIFVAGKEIISKEFGRIAAQTARQVIIQKIREAEKDNIYTEFKNKEGDIVGGVVYRMEKKAVIVDLLGKAEGILPHSFMSPLDNFRMGERIKSFVFEVKKEKGAQIILSRRHEGLVKKLFALEVPEIYEGIVEIRSIAREAGERTKIAVFSKDDKVDCVGACVGIRGARVKNIIDELRGEKIDIIRWSDDMKEYIKAALSPTAVSSIELDRENKRARVIVPNDQLSLAIGRKGQNVRLASKLVGWEIDVRSKEGLEEEAKEIAQLKSVGKKFSAVLVDLGYETITQLSNADPAEIAKAKKGIGPKKAAQIVQEAKDKLSRKSQVQEEKKPVVETESAAQVEPEVKVEAEVKEELSGADETPVQE